MKTDRRGVWTGLYRHGSGWRAVVHAGKGWPQRTQHFARETPPQEMQAWRQEAAARIRLERSTRAHRGSFAGDARTYLAAVKALPSYTERERDIDRWIQLFGTRRRATITPVEIRAARDRWMLEPRGIETDGTPRPPYAASTINHRLRALSNLWTVLDGRRAANPVRDVPEVPEPDALPRAIGYDAIERIIAALPDRSRPVKGKKGPAHRKPSQTKARLRVMAYTGLTYSQLGRLSPDDVDLERGTMLVKRRRKGKGARPRMLPLLPQAIEAFRQLEAAHAWGEFSGASARKCFLVAVKKVRQAGVEIPADLRPNDLRHSFGSAVYRGTGSREVAKDMLSHENIRTTERYTLAAVSEVLAAQMAKVTGK